MAMIIDLIKKINKHQLPWIKGQNPMVEEKKGVPKRKRRKKIGRERDRSDKVLLK
jgi:DNA-directed RNA polymerase subunit H (RpoH/RPB5)